MATTLIDAKEPWHIRYTRGDAIPAAVLAYEQELDDMDQTDKLARQTSNPNRTIADHFYDDQNLRDWLVDDPADASEPPVNPPGPKSRIAQLLADVAALKARPPVQSAPVDPAALKAVLLDPAVLAAIGEAVLDEQHRRDAE